MDGRDLLAIADESLPGEARWLSTEHAASAVSLLFAVVTSTDMPAARSGETKVNTSESASARHERMLEHGLQIR